MKRNGGGGQIGIQFDSPEKAILKKPNLLGLKFDSERFQLWLLALFDKTNFFEPNNHFFQTLQSSLKM